MKIDFKGVLISLLFLALCLTNIIQCNEEERIPTTDISYHTLDSLGRVISALEKYETDIKNFSDVYVISDDSIARYIRQRIESL